MQNTKNKFDHLTISDLQDIDSFKKWLRQALVFYGNDKIPPSHLLIYLNYIETEIMNNDGIDKDYWLQLIQELKIKAQTFIRVENQDEL